MSTTCFWTDLVGTTQVCPAEQEPEPPGPPASTFENFIFGPVQNADAAASGQILRVSDPTFSSWAPAYIPYFSEGFSSVSNGPGLVVFQGPAGWLWVEYAGYGYTYANAVDALEGTEESFWRPIPHHDGGAYSNLRTYYGSSNDAGVGRASQSPPFFQSPQPLVAEGARWWNGGGYTDDGGVTWGGAGNFPADLDIVACAARTGIVAFVCRSTAPGNTSNRLVWSTNSGASWNNIALSGGPVQNLAIAMSPTQVYRAAGTLNTNAQFSNTTALGTTSNVGGAFPKRRAWFTGTAWLVERLSTPVQIQRYTDLSTTGTSVFSFPAGTTPCGAFLAMGGGRIVVPVLLSSPANHVDFYVSTDDGLTFTLAPGMRLDIGDGAVTGYTHGFTIAYRAPP